MNHKDCLTMANTILNLSQDIEDMFRGEFVDYSTNTIVVQPPNMDMIREKNCQLMEVVAKYLGE